jgi:peptidoglycan hydrolase-like protein with peptidoglycan-binding domain
MTAEAKTIDKKPIMAAALLAILILGYFTRNQWMSLFTTSKIASDNGDSTTSNSTSKPSISTGIKKDLVLKKGDKNDSVKELQRILNLELAYQMQHSTAPPSLPKLSTDGDFGPKTEAMLGYQSKVGQGWKTRA